MVPMRSITWRRAPSPMASITITEATPITMPSKVRLVRTRFTTMPRHALRAASSRSAHQEAVAVWCGASFAVGMVSGCAGAASWSAVCLLWLSLTMRPSWISITRRAWAATDRSCVISRMVCPASASSFSKAMTSAPLWESSAPVGSSARITLPPFINARAIDTRCCCPPESWWGRLCSLVLKPRRFSRLCALCIRASLETPA